MTIRADQAPPSDQPIRLTPKLVLAAGLEIAAAAALAALVMREPEPPPAAGHVHSGMTGMHSEVASSIHWSFADLALGALAVGALIWWATTRTRTSAGLAAAAAAAFAASAPVRALAATSHLVAMAALEVLAVAAPLLLIAAAHRATPASPDRTIRRYSMAVITATAGYSALLIALHLPGMHDRAGRLGSIPLWLAPVIAAVGIAYWGAILGTAGRVRTSVRRRALVIGQEVGAILGLAAIIRPTATMEHVSPLGISAQLDHRLGGVLMLATCAAVTLPLLKRLAPQHDEAGSGAGSGVG